MLQIDFLTELFAGAKERGIYTCLDTSGIMFPGCGGTSEEERERLKLSLIHISEPTRPY